MPPTVVVSMQRAASNVADAASAPTDALVMAAKMTRRGRDTRSRAACRRRRATVFRGRRVWMGMVSMNVSVVWIRG
jgi:hypothetical protein